MDFTWKIGGAQGEGIQHAGESFALTLHRLGYYCFTYRRDHTSYQIRVGEVQLRNHGEDLDMLVALDQPAIAASAHELTSGSLLIYEADAAAAADVAAGVRLCPVPFTQIATELGSASMKTMVALGAVAGLLGMSERSLIEERLADRGQDVVGANLEAVRRGFAYVGAQGWKAERGLPMLPEIPRPGRLLISGNEALVLGALAGGCRFLVASALAPTAEITERMTKYLKDVRGAALQAKDEPATINMAVGAAHTGVRAMTATSGPGFARMMETLGRAGIREIPLVIINVQPGRALPTTTGRGDLNEMLYGPHGGIPRIVLAPSTPEECFVFAAEAFSLAEQYTCPVILASDLYLGQSRQSIEPLDLGQVDINRGKLESFDPHSLGFHFIGPADPDLLLVGWGSTFGPLAEAERELHQAGVRVSHLHLGVMMPFPTVRVGQYVAAAGRIVVVEQAAEGQLAGLIMQYAGGHGKLTSYTKYDGNPITKSDVIAACTEVHSDAAWGEHRPIAPGTQLGRALGREQFDQILGEFR